MRYLRIQAFRYVQWTVHKTDDRSSALASAGRLLVAWLDAGANSTILALGLVLNVHSSVINLIQD
jgi:hypothetical protein